MLFFKERQSDQGCLGIFHNASSFLYTHTLTHPPIYTHIRTHTQALGMKKLPNLKSLQITYSGSFFFLLAAPHALQLSCILHAPLFLMKSWISVTIPHIVELLWPYFCIYWVEKQREEVGLPFSWVASILLAHQSSFLQVTSCL